MTAPSDTPPPAFYHATRAALRGLERAYALAQAWNRDAAAAAAAGRE